MKTKPESGLESIEVVDMPYPKLQPGWVIIRVKKAGICGSDLHTVFNEAPTTGPFRKRMLGHEFSGEIVEFGEGVTDVAVGDRVVANPKYHCGGCYYCRSGLETYCLNASFMLIGDVNGSLAEYVTVPDYSLFKLPDEVSFEEGALCEPFTISLYGVYDLSSLEAGQTVVVVGPGPIGIATTLAAKLATPRLIAVAGMNVDVTPRLKLALKMGADVAINVEEEDPVEKVMELTDGLGADVVYECAGAGLLGQGLRMLRSGGEFVAIGLPPVDRPVKFDADEYWMAQRKHLKILFDILYDWKTWYRCMQLLKSGRIDLKPLITHWVSLEDAVKGFDLALKKEAVKVMVTP